jgi:Fur family iron response transcriptional regulator
MVGISDKRVMATFHGEAVDVLLARHDITPTQQRQHIASILFAQPQHLSAEQVLEQVNREQAVASKATVYNTLGLFVRKGLIREVIVDPSKIFYDSNTQAHHHFYHVDSGQLQDISAQELTLHNLPTPPQGTEVDGVDIIVRVRSTHA